jgi:hypothetical protein
MAATKSSESRSRPPKAPSFACGCSMRFAPEHGRLVEQEPSVSSERASDHQRRARRSGSRQTGRTCRALTCSAGPSRTRRRRSGSWARWRAPAGPAARWHRDSALRRSACCAPSSRRCPRSSASRSRTRRRGQLRRTAWPGCPTRPPPLPTRSASRTTLPRPTPRPPDPPAGARSPGRRTRGTASPRRRANLAGAQGRHSVG